MEIEKAAVKRCNPPPAPRKQSPPQCIPLTAQRLQLDQCEIENALDSWYFQQRTELMRERINGIFAMSQQPAFTSEDKEKNALLSTNFNVGSGGLISNATTTTCRSTVLNEIQQTPTEEAESLSCFIFDMEDEENEKIELEEKDIQVHVPQHVKTTIAAPRPRRVTPSGPTPTTTPLSEQHHPQAGASKMSNSQQQQYHQNIPSPPMILMKSATQVLLRAPSSAFVDL